MKLALGTVQFGLEYGAFNQEGRPSPQVVATILARARSAGIDLLDTARAYGDAEEVLGAAGAADDFRIVTKLPSIVSGNDVYRLFADSCRRLNAERVYGLLLHRASDLLAPDGESIWKALQEIRANGQAQKIGVSAYGPEDALPVLERFQIDLIQVPLSVFDRRHLNAGTIALCKRTGVEVHARSAFLQGFALSSPAALPAHLKPWHKHLEKFRTRCFDVGVTPVQGALAYAVGVDGVSKVVVGVDGLKHLEELIAAAAGPLRATNTWDELACGDLDLIDPSRWRPTGQ